MHKLVLLLRLNALWPLFPESAHDREDRQLCIGLKCFAPLCRGHAGVADDVEVNLVTQTYQGVHNGDGGPCATFAGQAVDQQSLGLPQIIEVHLQDLVAEEQGALVEDVDQVGEVALRRHHEVLPNTVMYVLDLEQWDGAVRLVYFEKARGGTASFDHFG